MTDIWSRLGIAPTTDQAALRRAYAERLKHTRPDVDPEGFRALREAFDAARQDGAARKGGAARAEAVSLPETPSPAGAIRESLSSGNLLAAARGWHRAMATGDLVFDEEPLLQEEIARAVVDAPAMTLALLNEAAGLMAWEAAASRLHAPPAVVEVEARRAALAWLAKLEAAARAGWRWRGATRRLNHAARLLLLPAPGRLRRWFPYVFRGVDFAPWWPGLRTHRRWLGAAIDPARVAWCEASGRRVDARFVSRLFRLFVFWFLPFVLGGHLIVALLGLLVSAP
jgi:hypothetical protein